MDIIEKSNDDVIGKIMQQLVLICYSQLNKKVSPIFLRVLGDLAVLDSVPVQFNGICVYSGQG